VLEHAGVLHQLGGNRQRRGGDPSGRGGPEPQLHHPIVGDLTFAYEALELPADHGQRILVYTAEPASPSDDALKLLATWSATTPLAEPHADAAH
jgi:MmyB-like transcription regulator ligand binding domain